jgi:hypothetical protein
MSRALGAAKARTVILTEGEMMEAVHERHEFHTPYGDIQCKSLSWNSKWSPIGDEVQQLCEFGPFHVTKAGGWDSESLEKCAYYAGRGEHQLFCPSHEDEIVGDQVRKARQAVANIIKHLASYTRPEDFYDLFDKIAPCDFAFYLQHGNLRKSFPLIENICLQQSIGGYVYLLSDQQGHYKIGKAVKIDRRIAQLKTQPPFKLQLLASTWDATPLKLEGFLHGEHASQRLNGEWFAFPQSDLNFLLDYFNTYNQGWVLLKAFYEESKQSVLDGKPVTQFQGSLWDLVIKLSTSDAKPDSGKGGPDEQDIS